MGGCDGFLSRFPLPTAHLAASERDFCNIRVITSSLCISVRLGLRWDGDVCRVLSMFKTCVENLLLRLYKMYLLLVMWQAPPVCYRMFADSTASQCLLVCSTMLSCPLDATGGECCSRESIRRLISCGRSKCGVVQVPLRTDRRSERGNRDSRFESTKAVLPLACNPAAPGLCAVNVVAYLSDHKHSWDGLIVPLSQLHCDFGHSSPTVIGDGAIISTTSGSGV